MLYKEASKAKTVDASKVPTQATVNNGQIILTGFSTNFKFTEDGENQINFEITNNSVDVVSDSIININYDSVTQTTTFDLLLEVAIRDLAAGGIGISIYLDNVYITTINTDIDYGETIMSDLAYEVRFVNGAKPYAEVAAYYQTNFDFRVEGEQVDEKPLLTAE
ncbi:MAG: hypothetical protein MJ200_04435 [Mycoplasmoidaceae bacterium]|nr:hypothetical protein [Mycoplasmoidaceae bacterium]